MSVVETSRDTLLQSSRSAIAAAKADAQRAIMLLANSGSMSHIDLPTT